MSSTKRETVCQEADRLTSKDRIEAYGHPKINFDDIARMWTVILRDVLKPGAKVSLTHVGLCNVATKICRHIARPKRDNLVDMAGYANTIASVEEEPPTEPDWCCGVCGMSNPSRYLNCDNQCDQDPDAVEHKGKPRHEALVEKWSKVLEEEKPHIEPIPENPSDIDNSPESIERAKTSLQTHIDKVQNQPIKVVEATAKATSSEDVLANLSKTFLEFGGLLFK